MQHLTLEELARLLDEAGTPDERAHLERCPVCAAELRSLREQTASLAALRPADPPPALWSTIEFRLRREGLIGRRIDDRAPALRAAAAVALFLLGSLAGGTAVRLAGSGPEVAREAPLADGASAAEALRAAEAEYLRALAEYASLTAEAEPVDPVSRLAALEGILLTTGAALQEAPADPIINNYHLTALGLRDALMREIATVDGEEWY